MTTYIKSRPLTCRDAVAAAFVVAVPGGGPVPLELYAVPFISAADGDSYVWYYPTSTTLGHMLGAPVTARILHQ
ncbi:MAG: hypothetical protein JFR38_08180 [Muribaculaceae bacterium]|nr:hypothetical protein [Muribaculaceae bacterium]